jgi:2-amino-4-hydroxy-6-hydroxymethyldihydropteridine diphosphokinase
MRAVIALGANVGDPATNVELAITLLSQASELIHRSSFHATKPVGGPPQPDFINAVCIVESELAPLDLLSVLQGIEKSMGRVRTEKWGPRIIDCDLITYGDIELHEQSLEIPHPFAHERRFVLEPWLEIDPDAFLQGHGLVRDILAQLPPAE